MSQFSRPAEDLSREAQEYIDLRLEDVKLRTVKGLSVTASKLVGMILLLGIAINLVLVLSFGVILLVRAGRRRAAGHRPLDPRPQTRHPVPGHLRPAVCQTLFLR